MRKFVNFFFLLPLAIILIVISVANRQPVVFSLDPLQVVPPVELPFFVFLFVAVIIGIIVGGSLTWVTQGKHRKALRDKSYEADLLKQQKTEAEPDKKPEEIAPGLPLISSSN